MLERAGHYVEGPIYTSFTELTPVESKSPFDRDGTHPNRILAIGSLLQRQGESSEARGDEHRRLLHIRYDHVIFPMYSIVMSS